MIFFLSGNLLAENVLKPFEMIRSSIDSMTLGLGDDDNRKRLDSEREELYLIIDKTLSPYFQKRYAGRLVLNQHWKSASANQRERFTEGLYQSLVRSYALTLLNFDVSQIRVLNNVIITPETKKLTVKSEVMYQGELIPMNFSFGKFKEGWRFYDVKIEGVSYIKNYRNQFNAEINANGKPANRLSLFILSSISFSSVFVIKSILLTTTTIDLPISLALSINFISCSKRKLVASSINKVRSDFSIEFKAFITENFSSFSVVLFFLLIPAVSINSYSKPN